MILTRPVAARGVALGVTSQLSGTFPSIGMSGFTWGTGDNALLLGTNVIGAIVAWGLMLLTLLENPFSSNLSLVSAAACCLAWANIVVPKQAWCQLQRAVIVRGIFWIQSPWVIQASMHA